MESAKHALAWDPNPQTREQIQRIVDENDEREAEARFGSRLEFGTAGLRGPMGAGSARMNDLTVIQATQVRDVQLYTYVMSPAQ